MQFVNLTTLQSKRLSADLLLTYDLLLITNGIEGIDKAIYLTEGKNS